MKKRKWMLAAIAALTLGWTGCTQDDTPTVQEQEIRIAARSEGGDGTGGTATAEAFTDDFTLELWSTTDATKHESHAMTYSDGWNIVKSGILPANALAYKGSGVSATSPTAYTVTLQADQSDADKLADADVMIATGTASAESPLDLNFKHYFAKLTFNYEMASEFGTSDAITVCTVKGTPDVSAYVESKTISAIVAPGTYTQGSEFVSITVSQGTPLIVKVPQNGLTFEAGKHYTFDLKVGRDAESANVPAKAAQTAEASDVTLQLVSVADR